MARRPVLTEIYQWVDEDEQNAAPEEDAGGMGGMGGMPGMEGMGNMGGMGGMGGDGGFGGIGTSTRDPSSPTPH